LTRTSARYNPASDQVLAASLALTSKFDVGLITFLLCFCMSFAWQPQSMVLYQLQGSPSTGSGGTVALAIVSSRQGILLLSFLPLEGDTCL
jgi:hypothetical protein